MERTRKAPPASSEEGEVVSLPSVEDAEVSVSPARSPRVSRRPEGLPPLASLIEEARAPSAGRAEVDALLSGLSQPLQPEHSPRERADLLLSLISDERIASYTGTDGCTVRSAAIQALIALGYPYALEVPPEALEAQSREGPGPGRDILSTATGRSGFGLIVLAALLQGGAGVVVGDLVDDTAFTAVALAIVFATTLLPALLAIGSRELKKVGIVWLKAVAVLWGAIGVLSLGSPALAIVPAIMAAILYSGARFMDTQEEG